MSLIHAKPHIVRTEWPSKIDVKNAYAGLAAIKAATLTLQQQALLAKRFEDASYVHKVETQPRVVVPKPVSTSQSSSSPIVPLDQELDKAFSKLPYTFTAYVGGEKLKAIQTYVQYCFKHPDFDFDRSREDDSVHAFNHIKNEGKVVLYLRGSAPFGNGTSKLVSKAWRLRIKKIPHNKVQVGCKLVARTDINLANLLLVGHPDERSHVADAEQEVKNHLQFKHPNICPIYHSKKYKLITAGKEHENVVSYLRYYPRSIRGMIKNNELQYYSLEEYARQMLEALVYLHSNNNTHGDLKPENIVISASELAYIDFGLLNRNLIGTKTFSPLDYIKEALVSKAAGDTKKDLWAMGGTLYLMYLSVCKDELPAAKNYIYDSPPWGLPLLLHEALKNEIALLKHLQNGVSASVLSETVRETKEPSKQLTELQQKNLHDCLMAMTTLKKEMDALKFDEWTSIVPRSFGSFIAAFEMIARFNVIKEKMDFMKKSPKEFSFLFPYIIDSYQDLIRSLEKQIERIAFVLEKIPPPSTKVERLIWMLMKPREKIPSASTLLEIFFSRK